MRALAAGVFGLLVGSRAFAEEARTVVHLFPAPDAGGAVQMAHTGAFSEIWFAQPDAGSLARVNADGTLTERHLPVAQSRPLAISRDTFFDGRIVFTEVEANRIGIIESGGALTEVDIPTPASNPRGIAGLNTIWFTEYDGNKIGRLQSGAPGSLVEFPVPTFASGPLGITTPLEDPAGTSGAWFTENLANKIGRIDSNGVITEYPIPTPDSGPTAIEAGPDGANFYFVETRGNKVARITPSGQITEFTVPTPNSSPADLAADFSFPGGLWVAERTAGKLAWMSLDGEFREFLLPGTARPESIVTDFVGHGYFAPEAVWYLDGTNRRVGRLSENHLFAIGAGTFGTLDTEFEFSNASDAAKHVRLGWPYSGVCPGFCPVTSIDLDVPRRAEVEAAASEVPFSLDQRLFQITGIRPDISDVPETHAWVVDETRPGVRIEVPLVSYWTIATMQPPLPRGSNGPQPFLTFPARRGAGFQTHLILAAIATEEFDPLSLEIEVLEPDGDVVASLEIEIFDARYVVLDDLLSELDIFGNFDGFFRVKRVSREGLFWGVAEIYENDVLTRLMPPGSGLEPPEECTGGPRQCRTRTTRVVTRDAP